MELEFQRSSKQYPVESSKEKQKQSNHVSKYGNKNTPSNKCAIFVFKDQKIKFRFPLIDEKSCDFRSVQQETLGGHPQIKHAQKPNLQQNNSIKMEEENKENVNILLETPFYEVNKIDTFKIFNQNYQNKLHEQ
ncbi:unnamed protein product (macronuclear) [Paramecium tetraurelia]|uniref:Uncharacterized protein n=1 Tax=Paramecium tetraurelia TaxID=5888 RepID=A0DGC9_PARTE|nr:uncharacterized protein GSPATT00002225001 [Paramecium tetraurelia]CAK82096.1 unnamed protein product [Paramecium tetraurelia]|eukprot:XP_001449493.1 hypothetical protein (macronuclear) [Paramecium tetraurelia strain d4-2]